VQLDLQDNYDKTGDVHITLRRVRATIVVVVKQ